MDSRLSWFPEEKKMAWYVLVGFFLWDYSDGSEYVVFWINERDRKDKMEACAYLAEQGLIEWHRRSGASGNVIGTGRITAAGLELVELAKLWSAPLS